MRKTGKILTIEEGTRTLGWGTEVIAQVSEAFGSKPIQTKRIGAKDVPIPAAISLEHLVLPDVEDIVKAALEMTKKG